MQSRKQLLIGGRATPQCEAPDLLTFEIDLTAHETVQPVSAGKEALSKHGDTAFIVGSTNKDHRAAQRFGQIEDERTRHRATFRSCLSTFCRTRPMRADVFVGQSLQCLQVGYVVTLPDLGLPQGVEPFDHILHAMLKRRHERRNHSKSQTESADASHCVSEMMCPLEHRAVVLPPSDVRRPV